MNYCTQVRRRVAALTLLLATFLLAAGCSPTQPFYFFEDGDLSHYVGMATNIEYPDVATCSLQEVNDPRSPLTLSNARFDEAWDLCLADAVRISLENGKVMRSLGVRITSPNSLPNVARTNVSGAPDTLTASPSSAVTVYEPALVETDPIFGVEGALSPYDAQFVSSMLWNKRDTPQNLNPLFTSISNRVFQQDLGTFQSGITKTAVTGGTFTAFNNTVYNANNSVQQQTHSSWNQNFEIGFNQPLLQGAGSLYNRIAGPFDPLRGIGTFLQYDGVVIARIRTDIRLADFEAGVRNFVADIENAYWELYFAYRNLEATKTGRDSALQTWKQVHAKYLVGAKGGEAAAEAQSREQYYLFRATVEQALSDLYKQENRLRYLMGLAATDGRLIRPCDEPTDAKVLFDWCEIHTEGLCRAVEIRQQKWRIKQREMELIASKNLLLPRLDVSAKYRWLGLGQDLLNYPGDGYNPSNTAESIRGTDAFSTLADGNFQEWESGLTFSMPIGFRQPLTAVRNAQLQLARERSILQDQELELSHQLADSIRDIDTTYTLAQSNFNRRVAAQEQVKAVQAAYDAGTVNLDLLLEAQRSRADAEAAYHRSLTDYNKGIMFVHFRKGSLLEYNGIHLAEGPWPAKAYFDATRRARARDAGMYMNYGFSRPAVFSQGAYPQFQHGQGGEHADRLPTQAEPEDILTPTPQRSTAPSQSAPNNGFELPAPTPGPAAKSDSGPRLISAGKQSVPGKTTAPAAKANSSRSTLTVSGASEAVSASSMVDDQVRQASGEGFFEWGDLSLGAAADKTAAKRVMSSSTAGSNSGSWKSAGSDASEATGPNVAGGGWKRAQR